MLGAVIAGKYQLKRLIGTGGMGEVFEAENRVLKRMVAIKIVRGAIATPEAIARLEREVLLVSAVQHPNICDVYDAGSLSDGSPFIVLERLYGETLDQVILRENRLPLDRAIDLFAQVLSGLQAAHGAQIVHRDLKPQNVFCVDRLGCAPLVKLLDFGLARDISGLRAKTITRPGALLGTLRYMSPEQLLGKRVDARADLFAVGVMLYEALSGRHPFDAPTMADLQASILRSSPTPIADVPRAVADVVERCLAKNPDDRWKTAVDVQRALHRAAGHSRDPLDAPSSDDPRSR
jgi:serine/threonine-protein kinase